jgi:hypothetical protein
VTDRLAWTIAVLVAISIGVDFFVEDGSGVLFLTRKFLDFIDWVAFWR